jgi:ERCC4-type nuclease
MATGPHWQLDVREHALAEAMRARGIRFEFRQLDTGDALLVAESGFSWRLERKTWCDLEASIKDGRWREQRERMLAGRGETEWVGYVLEGAEVPLRFSKQIAGAWIHLELRDGLPVFRTRDVDETAWLLGELRRKIVETPASLEPMRPEERIRAHTRGLLQASKAANRSIPTLMWAQIPGVSGEIAEELARRFPTMRAACDAVEAIGSHKIRVQFWAKIPHPGGKRTLGPKLAERILQILGFSDS